MAPPLYFRTPALFCRCKVPFFSSFEDPGSGSTSGRCCGWSILKGSPLSLGASAAEAGAVVGVGAVFVSGLEHGPATSPLALLNRSLSQVGQNR